MFCSHCGKTVDPAAEKCPHCGARLGDSRLSGHTAVQARILPAEQEGERPVRYTPYTKTTYTGEMDPGADVYSRTAYRPVLAEEAKQPGGEEPRPQEGAEPDGETAEEGQADLDALLRDKPVVLDEAQRAALQELEKVPDDAPAPDEAQKILAAETGIQVRPLKPIKKKGISPEVESYIQRMEAMKGKKSAKKKGRREDEGEDMPQQAEAENQEYEGEDAPEAASAPRPRAPGRARHWIGRIAAIVLIVAVIGGGLFYLAYVTQPKSPITGVTAELFDQGVQLIKSHTTEEYRSAIVALYQGTSMAEQVAEQQAKDRAEISALLPQRPQENDQKFIDTLLTIQDAIDEATTTDALAALTQGDNTLNLSGESSKQWSIIENYVTRLEDAKELSMLDIVSTGVQDVMATPTPSPTPSVEQYTTLSKGSKGQAVRNLQERLRDLGWFQGNVDGKYGTVTQTAIKYFQQAAGLNINGIADGELQALLFGEEAPVKGQDTAPTPAPTPASAPAADAPAQQ